MDWCIDQGIDHPKDIVFRNLQAYIAHLSQSQSRRKRSMHPNTIKDHLASIKGFSRWLNQAQHILSNPAKDLVLPKSPHRIPRILSTAEIERIMAQPDLDTMFGLRNRTIMETFYATAIRSSELARLTITDIDLHRELIWIRMGKGRKDRLVPITERGSMWIERYLKNVRHYWIAGPDSGTLFLTPHGKPLHNVFLSKMVKKAMIKAGIKREGACHLFRHSVATMMMERGADLRVIQEMLGHSTMQATQIYTHVSIAKLREVHKKSHPAE